AFLTGKIFTASYPILLYRAAVREAMDTAGWTTPSAPNLRRCITTMRAMQAWLLRAIIRRVRSFLSRIRRRRTLTAITPFLQKWKKEWTWYTAYKPAT